MFPREMPADPGRTAVLHKKIIRGGRSGEAQEEQQKAERRFSPGVIVGRPAIPDYRAVETAGSHGNEDAQGRCETQFRRRIW